MVKRSDWVLGLDLGTTSVGWALVDPVGEHILDMGVRIFPETLDGKSLEPLNKKRRAARLLRRQTRRRRDRRMALTEVLHKQGLLPAFGSDGWKRLMAQTDPYALRAKGMDAPLSAHELGRALYHLEKRRGYRAPSHGEEEEAVTEEQKAQSKEDGKVKQAISDLDAALGDGTLGQYFAAQVAPSHSRLADPDPVRGNHLGREQVEAEFDRLIQAQAPHHPILQDAAFVSGLRDKVFFQRPTYWQEKTLGRCDLERDAPLALKADWVTQETTMLETVNALRDQAGNNPPLTEAEREVVLNLCRAKRKVTFGEIRRALKMELGLADPPKFTHEKQGRKDIPGNATEAALITVFGAAWDDHPKQTEIRDELALALWHCDYHPVGKRPNRRINIRTRAAQAAARAALAAELPAKYGITEEQAKALSQLRLPSGWSRHAKPALTKMLPFLNTLRADDSGSFNTYRDARDLAYPEAMIKERRGRDALPSHPRHLEDVRNPAVIRTVNELRKVVNNLIRKYGKPGKIRVEMSRDLKLSPKERNEVSKTIAKNEKKRKDAAKKLEEEGVRPSRTNILKYLLWLESDCQCPYTGKPVSFEQLDTPQYELEHIIPRSRSNDNRAANLTLCETSFNRRKGNRTPFEMMGGTAEWDAFVARVRGFENMPKAKKDRLCREMRGPFRTAAGRELDDPSGEAMSPDGAERSLRDSSYGARLARDFLLTLYPSVEGRADPVETVSSKVTVELRYRWGLHNVISEKDRSEGKDRSDHRHHAVDALAVALAEVSYTQRLSRYHADEKKGQKPFFPLPWAGFRRQALERLDQIVVSHRARRKASGPLHEETVLRDLEEERKGSDGGTLRSYVTRKPVSALTAGMMDQVRDPAIRKVLQDHLAAQGGNLRKAFGDPENPPLLRMSPKRKDYDPDWARPIKSVRILVEQKPELMVALNARTKAYAKAGENHHMAIWRLPDGKAAYEVVSRAEAAQRLAKSREAGLARPDLVRRTPPDSIDPEAEFVMSLCLGDTLAFPRDDGGVDYRIVQSIWSGGQVVVCDHRNADGSDVSRPGPNALLKTGAYKVAVDPLGRVQRARD